MTEAIKHCIVTCCHNNTENRPDLIFLTVPKQAQRRKEWENVLNVTFNTKNYSCCELHFDTHLETSAVSVIIKCMLPNDASNWTFYKTIGKRIYLKPDVVPHLNIDARPSTSAISQLTESAKRRKLEIVERLKLSTCRRQIPQKNNVQEEDDKSDELPDLLNQSSFNYNEDESDVASSSESDLDIEGTKIQQDIRYNSTLVLLEKCSRFYLGLTKEMYNLVQFLSDWTRVITRNIFIVLKKVRLNDQEIRLANDFGISIGNISQIIREDLPRISTALRTFIYFPDTKKVKFYLPIAFRYRYKNLHSIIDCLEIQIQQPSNLFEQSLTWSEYKKCYTIKYLVSCTPHGYINYISQGFGGRISDSKLITESDYLTKCPHNADVMADRSFKNIENIMLHKGCKVVRPPCQRVSSNKNPSRDDMREMKRTVAVMIHVKRVIKRIRESLLPTMHAGISHKQIMLLNDMVVVGCAVCNTQGALRR